MAARKLRRCATEAIGEIDQPLVWKSDSSNQPIVFLALSSNGTSLGQFRTSRGDEMQERGAAVDRIEIAQEL